jgi:glycosyltransferase involved in cell wall biosynthesis
LLGDRVPEGVSHQKAVSTWIGFPAGILTRMLTISTAATFAAQYIEFLVTLLLAVRSRKRPGYDVVYLRDGDPFLFVPLFMGLFSRRRRWVVSLVGILGKRSYAGYPRRFLSAPIWRPLYRRSLSWNRYVFVCEGRHMGKFFNGPFLNGLLAGRVIVIPKGVTKPDAPMPATQARHDLGLPRDKVILLHFGALHPGKDLAPVLEALTGMPNTLLVHAGAVTSSIDPVGLAHRLGVADRVIVRSYHVPEAEKPRYFWAADALILSYKKDFLQLPSMLWEAARFAVPAIASDVGELGEWVRRYDIGLVFEPEDGSSFANALSAFVSLSASDRQTMAGNCARFCDDFSLDTWAHRSLTAITELCAPERGQW